MVRCESALWADAQSLESLFPTLSTSLRNEIRSFIDPIHHFLLIFQLREFTCYYSKNYMLVQWKMLQWLKTAGTGSVVFEIECDVVREILEHLFGNTVVGTFAEVSRIAVVACVIGVQQLGL